MKLILPSRLRVSVVPLLLLLGFSAAAQHPLQYAPTKATAAQTAWNAYVNALISSYAQPLDSDLTTIAGLTATTDNFIQAKAGAWSSRTPAQVKTDLNLTGTNSGDQTIILSGDATGSGTSNIVVTLPTVNGTAGSFGSATQGLLLTVNAKGQVTAAANVTITPAVSSLTGAGTGVLAALAQALNSANGLPSATSPKFFNSATLGNGTGNPLLYLDGGAGGVRGIDFYTAGSLRFRIATSGSETGANAGADILVGAYSDAGSVIAYPMGINRSSASVSVRAPASSSAATQFPVFIADPTTGSPVQIWSRTPTQAKSDMGMASVENTALSTWGGSANIVTVGTLASGAVPASLLTGTIAAARMPAFTGDITVPAGSTAATMPTVNANVGTFGSASQVGQFTVNAKGLVTAASNVAISLAISSVTGLGTGIATWLATPTSANLAAALTDETGINGGFVRADGATVTNMVIGVAGSAQKVAGYDSSGNLSFFNISKTVAEYINTLTGNAQTQLDGKEPTITTLAVGKLPTSGVTAGSYGNASYTTTITVDTYGRITAVTTNAISGGGGGSTTTSFVTLDGSVGVTTISAGNGFTNGGVVINMTGHGLTNGAVVWFQNSTKGPLLDTAYYATVVDADNYKISTSQANRVAATFVAATASGVCYMRRWDSNPILASSNVDGVIRPWSKTAGSYIVDFTTNPSDANYAVSGSAKTVTDGTPLLFTGESRAATASAFAVQVTDTSGGLTDSDRVSITATR